MPGLDFSGPWVSVFTIIVKVIEYKKIIIKKIKKLTTHMNLENFMVIILSLLFRSIFFIKLFVSHSDLASSDRFFTSASE